MLTYGQIVVGPPASGKSTYCHGMYQFLNGIKRKTIIVNLDPANDFLVYPCEINVMDLISLDTVMNEQGLGPNGGQVELFTNYSFVSDIVKVLEKDYFRLVCTHLVDAHYCTDASKFISVLLLSLKTMMHLELPHINILSKVDLIEAYGKLAFNLDYYSEVLDLSYLLDHLNNECPEYSKLNEALCELIEDFSLVTFEPLNIQDKDNVYKIIKLIDKTLGISI